MSDQQEMKEFRKNIKRWEEHTLQSVLDKFPERQEHFITASSELINRLYTPADLDGFNYDEEIGYPGLYPFTRGVHPTMYRSRQWTMRMFAGFGTAEETNQRFKYLLKQGTTGLSVAFDMPTLMGFERENLGVAVSQFRL